MVSGLPPAALSRDATLSRDAALSWDAARGGLRVASRLRQAHGRAAVLGPADGVTSRLRRAHAPSGGRRAWPPGGRRSRREISPHTARRPPRLGTTLASARALPPLPPFVHPQRTAPTLRAEQVVTPLTGAWARLRLLPRWITWERQPSLRSCPLQHGFRSITDHLRRLVESPVPPTAPSRQRLTCEPRRRPFKSTVDMRAPSLALQSQLIDFHAPSLALQGQLVDFHAASPALQVNSLTCQPRHRPSKVKSLTCQPRRRPSKSTR